MLKYLSKNKSKKGFTVVELIVVIAVIAILAAVAVPNYIASNRKGQAARANERARGFYLAIQNVLLNAMENDNTEKEFSLDIGGNRTKRISGTNPITGYGAATPSDPRFFVYAEADGGGNFTTFELTLTTVGDFVSGSSPTNLIDSTTFNTNAINEFSDEVTGYLASDGEEGHYYAMFDSQFRVTMAYYSQFVDKTAALGAGFANDAGVNSIIDGRVFGAFPIQYTLTGTINVLDSDGNPIKSNVNRGTAPQWFVQGDMPSV